MYPPWAGSADMKDSLGKTISTLTRVLEGRPTKKDKAAGWSGATLYVL